MSRAGLLAVIACAASVSSGAEADDGDERDFLVPVESRLNWHIDALPPRFNVGAWDSEDGLPQDTVRATLQAGDGHIWVATSEGVGRFNGSGFTVYNRQTTAQFPNVPIVAMIEASDGSFWLATDGNGVARLHNGEITRYSTSAGLANPQVSALAEGADGTIWIGTYSGLNRFADGKLSAFPLGEGLAKKSVRAIHRAANGELWIGITTGIFIVQVDGTVRPAGEGFAANGVVRKLYEDTEGGRWIVTDQEIVGHRADGTVRFTAADGVDPSTVEAILRDRFGTLWVGTTVGLLRLQDGRLQPDSIEGTVKGEHIRSLYEDRESSLWIGTNVGLKRARRTAFSSLGVDEGLSHNTITSVTQDAAGALWVGTMGGGLNRFHGSMRVLYTVENGLLSDSIRGIHATRDGSVWVAFEQPGLVQIRDGILTRYEERDYPISSGARVLFEDSRGVLWIGARNGIFTLAEGRLNNLRKAKETNYRVRAFAEDASGSVWVGTNRGLLRYENEQFTLTNDLNGLSAESVRALLTDSDGVLWIGLNEGGLNWLKDGRFFHCTTKTGLPTNTILDIVDDESGNLWLTSRLGILRVSKAQLGELADGRRGKVDYRLFGRTDGIRGLEGSSVAKPGVIRASDGRLWFATVRSLAVVNPNLVPRNPVPPTVVITHVRRDNVEVDPRVAAVFPPGDVEFEFAYTALSYAQSEKIRYRYKLVGLNQDWVNAGNRRLATYGRIPPGKHRFEVQAMNSDGVWSQASSAFEFTLEPYYYQTWWFFGVVAVAGGAIGAGVYTLRMRIIRARERELVELVGERTARLRTQIQERTRAQEALKLSEALYHSLVEILPVNVYRKDREGRLTFANKHFCDRLGKPLPELIGRTDSELFSEEIARKNRAADEHVVVNRAPLTSEDVETGADGVERWFDCLRIPVLNDAGEVVGIQGLAWDVTARKQAELRLAQAQRELIDVSRMAGMAEVATGVLHNVGNVLNSVNVSASVVVARVRDSRSASLGKMARLFEEHSGDLAAFLGNDPRGRAIPGYISTLARHLAAEQEAIIGEMDQLCRNIDHIKNIVSTQQTIARVSTAREDVGLLALVEDALQVNGGALVRHRIELVRKFSSTPVVTTEKHKVLQILVNLIENAKHACTESDADDHRVVVSIGTRGDMAYVSVADTGVGISAENLTKIFGHGFTTRKHGHGFGLHTSALMARELGGQLVVRSAGPGLGAEFELTLPLNSAPDEGDDVQAPAAAEGREPDAGRC